MSEHTYRLIIGSLILILLYAEIDSLAYFIVAMTLFEGLTNKRLNLMITQFRRKFGNHEIVPAKSDRINFRVPIDAERAQRLFISAMFAFLYFAAPPALWMLNWFFGFGMLISGIVMFCPVVTFFRAVGFR